MNPQAKIISVANKLNMSGLKKQQGTTRIIYDSLPLDGRSVFRFFEGSNARVFPFTNLGSFGNKLEVGETLVCSFVYFSVFKVENNVITQITPPGLVPPYAGVTLGDWNFSIGNVQVMKPNPAMSQNPAFNKTTNSSSNVGILDTELVIPPLLEFVAELKTAGVGINETGSFLRMTIEGVGSIVNTRETY